MVGLHAQTWVMEVMLITTITQTKGFVTGFAHACLNRY